MMSKRTCLVFALGLGMSLAWGFLVFGSRAAPAAAPVRSLPDTSHRKTAQPAARPLSRPADPVIHTGANAPDASASAAPSTSSTSTHDVLWTHWDPDLYALADDGTSIWIAAGTGVVRWDKASGIYRRFGAQDGLPFGDFVAVAVDGAGNRWFGGSRGLSRLAADGIWTHFDAANSGLYADEVEGIAIGADGTLWLSHPDGNVSRRNPDGTWRWYPSRMAVVVGDYVEILQTQNANDLWTVAGDEVWVGHAVYDGSAWTERRPPGAWGAPIMTAADSQGTAWVLYEYAVYSWDGKDWSEYYYDSGFGTNPGEGALAVAPDDTVWVGWIFTACPYPGCWNHVIGRVPEEPGWIEYELAVGPGPITALLPTAEGLWATGRLWLLKPDESISYFSDVPYFPGVRELALDRNDFLWLFGHDSEGEGPIQVLDDHGTATLADDRWRVVPGPDVVTAFEPTPNGDMWVSGNDASPRVGQWPENARRYRQGVATVFRPGWDFFATDVFAQDDHRTFFAFHSGDEKGVLALDDGGTITDPSDDVWTTYPFRTDRPDGTVALDGLGRLWYGDVDGLYRYDGSAWVPINEDYTVADLAPATDGTLFAQIQRKGQPWDPEGILILWPDGRHEILSTEELVERELERVRSADRRNSLWAVATDGAVWYIGGIYHDELHRRDDAGLTVYPLPSSPFAPPPLHVFYPIHYSPFVPPPLEVDSNGHVWSVFHSGLRRLSPAPGFTLDVWSDMWLLAPGGRRHAQMAVTSQEGYAGSVWLELSGLPPGVTATLVPNPVPAAETFNPSIVAMNLEAGPETALGTYSLTLSGTDHVQTETLPVRLSVVTNVFEFFLPLGLK